MDRVRLDTATRAWMYQRRYSGAARTVVMCWACGLYYMPELGHDCKAGASSKVRPSAVEAQGGGAADGQAGD